MESVSGGRGSRDVDGHRSSAAYSGMSSGTIMFRASDESSGTMMYRASDRSSGTIMFRNSEAGSSGTEIMRMSGAAASSALFNSGRSG